ncbi:MAG: hypothetical protein H6951_00015 [Zoogloeaceae bacterium]|nr:hypothetical protein [Zoogloeaceae bacterium]
MRLETIGRINQRLTAQCLTDQRDHGLGQMRQIAHPLVLDFAVVAASAAQEVRAIALVAGSAAGGERWPRQSEHDPVGVQWIRCRWLLLIKWLARSTAARRKSCLGSGRQARRSISISALPFAPFVPLPTTVALDPLTVSYATSRDTILSGKQDSGHMSSALPSKAVALKRNGRDVQSVLR